jgi:hypothetical protein
MSEEIYSENYLNNNNLVFNESSAVYDEKRDFITLDAGM